MVSNSRKFAAPLKHISGHPVVNPSWETEVLILRFTIASNPFFKYELTKRFSSQRVLKQGCSLTVTRSADSVSGLGSLLPSLFHLLMLPVARGQSRRSFWRLPRVVPRRGIRGVEACSSPGLTRVPLSRAWKILTTNEGGRIFLTDCGPWPSAREVQEVWVQEVMTRQGDHRASHCNTKVHQKTGRETEALYKAVKEKWLAFHRTEGNVSTYFIILVD